MYKMYKMLVFLLFFTFLYFHNGIDVQGQKTHKHKNYKKSIWTHLEENEFLQFKEKNTNSYTVQ